MPFALEQLSQGLSIAAVINPQQLSNASLNSGNGIDMSKFRRAMAIIQVGAGGGNVTAQLKAAKTSGGSMSAVGAAITAITTTNKQATIEVRDDELTALVGAGYQYLQLVITENNVANTYVSGVLLGGEGDWKPAAAQDVATVAQRLVL